MPSLTRLLFLSLLILALAACAGGGGGDGGGSGGSGGGSGGGGSGGSGGGGDDFATPPTIGGGDPTAGSPTVTIEPEADDPDAGDSLSFKWTVESGPHGVKKALFGSSDADGSTDATFPLKGVYTVKLTVTDKAGNKVSKTFTVDLSSLGDEFSISGSVSDQIGGSSTPADLDVELKWIPLSSSTIWSKNTDGSGDFTFDDLLGDPTDFQVLVPGS